MLRYFEICHVEIRPPSPTHTHGHAHTHPSTNNQTTEKKPNQCDQWACKTTDTPAKPLQCSDCYIREQLSNRIFAPPHILLLFLTLLASTGNDIQIRLCMHLMLLYYSLLRGQVYRNTGVCSQVVPQKGSLAATVESMTDVIEISDLEFA